ncbi:MAG: FkbM family methyltransferase [Saprospiraceae bacterium]
MDRLNLLERLERTAELAGTTRGGRLAARPGRYVLAAVQNKLFFPLLKWGLPARARTFYGRSLRVELPAGTDIYLTGGKTHPSELRLARYLIRHLRAGHHFLDVGAHFGYFSLLAAKLVGPDGRVTAVEAAPATYGRLVKNLRKVNHAQALHLALADRTGELTFYQFLARYSEYNAMDVTQYEGRDWLAKYPPTPVTVPCTTLDALALERPPNVIKMDVEGAEEMVIAGGRELLARHSPILVMEFLAADVSGIGSHRRAFDNLLAAGYLAYHPDYDGQPQRCYDPEHTLDELGWDSINLIFSKKIVK